MLVCLCVAGASKPVDLFCLEKLGGERALELSQTRLNRLGEAVLNLAGLATCF